MQLPDHTPFEIIDKISKLSKKDRKAIEKKLSGIEKLELRRIFEARSLNLSPEYDGEAEKDPYENISLDKFSLPMRDLIARAIEDKSLPGSRRMTEAARHALLKCVKENFVSAEKEQNSSGSELSSAF